MPTKGKTDKELWLALEGLDDDLLDPNMPDAMVEEELRQLGIDPDALARRTLDTVARAKEEERLSWQARARERRGVLEGRMEKTTVPETMDRGAMLARLNELRSSNSRIGSAIMVAARKRKPEQSSDEELRGLLEDMEALRAIEDDERNR